PEAHAIIDLRTNYVRPATASGTGQWVLSQGQPQRTPAERHARTNAERASPWSAHDGSAFPNEPQRGAEMARAGGPSGRPLAVTSRDSRSRESHSALGAHTRTSPITIGGTCKHVMSRERACPAFARYRASSMVGAVS